MVLELLTLKTFTVFELRNQEKNIIVIFRGVRRRGLTGLKPPEMLNILGVFACLV